MNPNGTYEVSYLRGKRDYVRAIDALAVAPITETDLTYRVRFHQLSKIPVHWQPVDPDGPELPVLAELRITGADGPKSWILTPNPSATTFAVMPNITVTLAEPHLCEMEEFEIALLPEIPFWEQLVAAVKIWGSRKYPHLDWSVAGASGSVECFGTITEEGKLRMSAGQQRMGLHHIAYDFAGLFDGKLMVASFPKDDSDEGD